MLNLHVRSALLSVNTQITYTEVNIILKLVTGNEKCLASAANFDVGKFCRIACHLSKLKRWKERAPLRYTRFTFSHKHTLFRTCQTPRVRIILTPYCLNDDPIFTSYNRDFWQHCILSIFCRMWEGAGLNCCSFLFAVFKKT